MRSSNCDSLVGLAFGLMVSVVGADQRKDRTTEMDAVARAFLRAFQATLIAAETHM